jgi:hypothetical protein
MRRIGTKSSDFNEKQIQEQGSDFNLPFLVVILDKETILAYSRREVHQVIDELQQGIITMSSDNLPKWIERSWIRTPRLWQKELPDFDIGNTTEREMVEFLQLLLDWPRHVINLQSDVPEFNGWLTVG